MLQHLTEQGVSSLVFRQVFQKCYQRVYTKHVWIYGLRKSCHHLVMTPSGWTWGFLHTSTDDAEISHIYWDEKSFLIEQNLCGVYFPSICTMTLLQKLSPSQHVEIQRSTQMLICYAQ